MKTKTKIWIYPLALIGVLLIFTSSCKKKDNNNNPTQTPSTIADIDGNIYHTVSIGTQVWMVENLKTTKYRNGDPIPIFTDNNTWASLKSGAYCNYNNDANNSIIYGRLYNWYSVSDSRNIAPIGWHVATDTEWTTLISFLGGNGAGGKLKESGTSHWQSPNTGATNETGFSALPGCYRYDNGTFLGFGCGSWWTSTESQNWGAVGYTMFYLDSGVDRGDWNKCDGLSVRCVKD